MRDIINYYPEDILKPNNIYRSVKILVKSQSSLSGAKEELKNNIEKKISDIKDIADGSYEGPSDEARQKGISGRIKKITKAQTVWGIALPLPNEVSDSQSHQWESTKGFVGETGGAIANADFGAIGIKTNVNKALGELASSSGFRKPLIDPGYFQDYNGTEPREFTFSWDLIPNNASEANNINSILYNLKKYTLPKSTISGVSLLSPYMFDIQIGNPKIRDLMNMNNLVCKSMSINYSAEGALQFLPDGTPKYIRLEMSFAERSAVTSEIY